MSEMPRITELWAFLSVDPKDGNEGIIGEMTPMGWMPFIAADKARLLSLEPRAQSIVKAASVKARLVRFSTREDIREILP